MSSQTTEAPHQSEVEEANISSVINEIQEIAEATTASSQPDLAKRRGRPKGSKNKPKVDVGFASSEEKPKRQWTRRKSIIETNIFMDSIVEPIMGQVAAGNMKKSIGMIAAAVCGRLSSLYYTGNTSPLQTLSSDITRFKKQPVYANEKIDGAKQIPASSVPPHEVQIPVYAQFNEEAETPQKIIDSFINICHKYELDADIFTKTGGHIALSESFIQAITEFALDKELWGGKALIVHKPKQ